MPRRMPRSPQLSTSGRHNEKIMSISAVHTPMPLRAESFRINSSSGAWRRGLQIQSTGGDFSGDPLYISNFTLTEATLLDL